MGQAVVYVDGMNLYHGIKAKYGRKYYLWLDLFAFATQLRRCHRHGGRPTQVRPVSSA